VNVDHCRVVVIALQGAVCHVAAALTESGRLNLRRHLIDFNSCHVTPVTVVYIDLSFA